MIYTILKDKIIIDSKQEFNINHILKCGQIFSYKQQEDFFVVYSADKQAVVKNHKKGYIIHTNDCDYFKNFFNLDVDYSKIKNQLKKYEVLKNPIQFGSGIRILKQDLFETIISFIVSANNNIKRIQKILFAIRELAGTNMGDYYAFPTLEQLSKISEQQFAQIGCGYRAKYLVNVCKQLNDVDLNNVSKMQTKQLKNFLVNLSGVGPKVADCILLFGFNRMDVFPVDTWIQKVYNTYFGSSNQTNRQIINKELVAIFGDLSGYAQQYLFYYMMNNPEHTS